MKLLLKWIIISGAVFASAQIIDGISVYPWYSALVVGACLVFINLIVKPVITLLTLPINIITLGLFSLVVNAALFWFLATLVDGFDVATFLAAFLGALLVSVINWLAKRALRDD